MFNIFPELLFLAPASALLIRAATAAVFATAAYLHFKGREEGGVRAFSFFAVVEIAIAGALAVGFYTQPAAIAGIVLVVAWFTRERLRPFSISTLFLLLVMCITLIVTGAGPLSFDLPL